jgi:tRNA threonylcarbamoyladenosine biosynthesis protein TsaB
MSLILHINTALDKAIVGLSRNNEIVACRENDVQKDHSSFLQPAILEVLNEAGFNIKDIDAVTVINGPGSYTGLRVGLSAAKGICFSLQKPLITLSTLEWLALPFTGTDPIFICPLIDARRMEVFTATYDRNLYCLSAPEALILDENSFAGLLSEGPVLFTGDGAAKLPKTVSEHPNARVHAGNASLKEQLILGEKAYIGAVFADIAYSEPFYLKAFYTPVPVKK